MSEYWKSTPSYWCKFCSQYVRDSPLERKNHDASGRHQNNISRSLRELHKGQERETRDKQRAKDEVARLNGLFSNKPSGARDAGRPTASTSRVAPPAANLNPAAQRKAHAEQLAAMGVALPEDLQKEVTGTGNFHVVSERALNPSETGAVSVNRSLAEVLAEAKRQPEDSNEDQNVEDEIKPALKRKLGEDEDEDEQDPPKRRVWGSNFKVYPGPTDSTNDEADLDALLNGVVKKQGPSVKAEGSGAIEQEQAGGEDTVKREEETSTTSLNTVPDISEPTGPEATAESALDVAPAVLFKKRKAKK